MDANEFIREVEDFNEFGTETVFEDYEWEVNDRSGVTRKAINEFWTSAQRQGNSLHEISYRACFKPQLPGFFISRLTEVGEGVYDPFMGRGTTLLEAFLQGRKPLGNDINPLSAALLEPRINPPTYEDVEARLNQIDLGVAEESYPELEVFFHPDTLRQIIALKEYFLRRQSSGEIDNVDKWIRMVAINRLTGHSPGFFSVYSLPPNQAVSIKSQRKINEKREQTPESKEIKPRILKRTKALLKDWNGVPLDHTGLDLSPSLTVEDAAGAMSIPSSSAGLVVTSPPFLDVVDYQGDNWMRCWFLGIDASTVEITELKKPEDWKAKMTEVMRDLSRILKPNGYLAFEVGEVTYKREKLLLEELVLEAGVEAGLEPVIIMINDQEFTKTSNAWGVDNLSKGTNTNRIVLFKNGCETMATTKIEVKTSESQKSMELNFEVASGKGTGRASKSHKKKTDKATLDSIKSHAEFHFAVKQEDENIDSCRIRRPVYVIRGKEKKKHERTLKGKKGWTRSLSTISHMEPDYYIVFDVCKLAKAYSVSKELIRKLLKDSRWCAKITEQYVAVATGGTATFNDKEPDVVVKNYDPNYLEGIRDKLIP